MHLISKRKNEIMIVETTNAMCTMVVKNIEIDGMTHDWWLRWWFEGFDSNEEEVVPKVDDVSLVDGVFDGAFGGDGDEDFVMGEGVVVSSSLVQSTKSFLGGIMVSLIFLEGLEEEAWVKAMEVEEK
ncbi:hypothetical protein Tco_0844917 [Tanacetum coccineum]